MNCINCNNEKHMQWFLLYTTSMEIDHNHMNAPVYTTKTKVLAMNTNRLYQSVVIQLAIPIGSIVQHKSQTAEIKCFLPRNPWIQICQNLRNHRSQTTEIWVHANKGKPSIQIGQNLKNHRPQIIWTTDCHFKWYTSIEQRHKKYCRTWTRM